MGDGDDGEGGGDLLASQFSDLFKDSNAESSQHRVTAKSQQQQLMNAFMSHDQLQHNRQQAFSQAPSSTQGQQQLSSHSSLFGLSSPTKDITPEHHHQLLNQRSMQAVGGSRLKTSGSNVAPLSASIMSDSFGFGFGSSTVASVEGQLSSSTVANSQQQQPSLFSSLASAAQRKVSALEQAFAEPNATSNSENSGRLSLSMLQAKHREVELEKQQSAVSRGGNSFVVGGGDPNEWHYTDPQGEVQGPFTWTEMFDWFSSGYFTMDLLVKRSSESSFSKLGDLCALYRGVPFFPVKPLASAGPSSTASPPVIFGGNSIQQHQGIRHQQGIPSPPLQQQTHHQHLFGGHPQHAQHHLLQQHSSEPSPNKAGNIGQSLFEPVPPSVKDDGSTPSQGSAILSMFQQQRQHSLPPAQVQQPPPVVPLANTTTPSQLQSDNQIATLLGIGPQNALQAQAQLRLILAQLMKNEAFHQLTTAQQQRIVMERFLQLNNSGNLQQQPPPNQYLNQQQPGSQEQVPHGQHPAAVAELSEKAARHEDMIIAQAKKISLQEEQQQHMADSFDGQMMARPASHHSSHSLHSSVGPMSPPPTELSLKAQGVPQVVQQQNPLQMLQAAMTVPSGGSAWGNLVPGAMSLSAVEELQRREAEEKFKLQQQQQQQLQQNQQKQSQPAEVVQEHDDEVSEVSEEFEHKVERKQRSSKKDNKQQSKTQQEVKQVPQPQTQPQPQPHQQQQQSGKVQVIDSKPSRTISESPDRMHQQSPFAAAPVAPPKKSAWGVAEPLATSASAVVNSASGNPLSISEIQKLQEEKEREEEAKRQADLQQMAAYLAQQQAAAAAAAASGDRGPLKWASQKWQQSETAVKTLAEIQAEEAEKAALVRAAAEAEARRRVAANSTVTPLAAIVKAGSASVAAATVATGGVWAGNSLVSSAKSSNASIWDEEENPTLSAAASISTANAVPAKKVSTTTKVDGALIKKILRTNPTNVKKLEVNLQYEVFDVQMLTYFFTLGITAQQN